MRKYVQIYFTALVLGLAFSGIAYAHCGHCATDKVVSEGAKTCCATKGSGVCCARRSHNENAKMNFGPKNKTK